MSGAGRLAYIDWLRGLAVVLMIQTHVYDSWLSPADRATAFYQWSRALGGAPAPLFLFLAGLALALLGEGRRRVAGPSGASAEGVKRGLEVLGYAGLFRLWMFTTGGFTRPADLLRVDVLNCIGLSMVLMSGSVLIWPRFIHRLAAAFAITALIAVLTPIMWDARPEGVPFWLRGYWSGRETGSLFPLFPWAGFTAAGAASGLVLDQGRQQGRERTGIAALSVLASATVTLGLALDRLSAPLHAQGEYWLTSPSFFMVRVGILLLLVGAAWLWHRTPWSEGRSPLRQLGRTSLLVYWVHIEIVYGFLTRWARARLGLVDATFALALVIAAMVALAVWRMEGRLLPLRGPRLPAGAA
jgi:uncharacterized membrane protein